MTRQGKAKGKTRRQDMARQDNTRQEKQDKKNKTRKYLFFIRRKYWLIIRRKTKNLSSSRP
jgi:hypothetical protein